MPINAIILRDFQCHHKLRVELDPHITTIIGPSDAGKSAVLRALRWVVFNHPRGSAFRRDGSDATSVVVEVDEGLVSRIRSDTENRYALLDKGFEAFADGVPPAIHDLFNLGPINFQAQHDSPFWFAETSGEVSRQLNDIVNLGSIDTVLGWISGQMREAASNERILKDRVATAQGKAQSLRSARDLHNDLIGVEEASKIALQDRHRCNMAHSLVEDGSNAQFRLEGAEKCLKSSLLALEKGELWEGLVRKSKDLAGLVAEGRKAARLATLDFTAVEVTRTRWEDIGEVFNTLGDMVRQGNRQVAIVKQTAKSLQEAEDELRLLIGKVCPLCQRPMIS